MINLFKKTNFISTALITVLGVSTIGLGLFGNEKVEAMDGPSFALPTANGVHSYVKSGTSLNDDLEFTARDLNNATNGISVDVQGYVKNSWALNSQIRVTYELKALNTYKDYLVSASGTETSLSVDKSNPIYLSSPVAYTPAKLVQDMSVWSKDKKNVQSGVLKTYTQTVQTLNNYEGFIKTFNFRTKVVAQEPQVKANESILILDNAARSYDLVITATNLTDGSKVTDTIRISVTTVKATAAQNKPSFENAIGISSPKRGEGLFVEEVADITWAPAKDLDNELIYYKIYYYYKPINEKGELSDEVRTYVGMYEDYPTVGTSLTMPYLITTTQQLMPVYFRVVACDINHACGEPTRSNPVTINDFGTAGGGEEGGESSLISVFPQPSNDWGSKNLDLTVLFTGDAKKVNSDARYYSVTKTNEIPPEFTEKVPANGMITLEESGIWYVHYRYDLTNGKSIYTSAGPYKIDKNPLGNFTVSLVNASGKTVTNWSNTDLKLKVSNPSSVGVSGYQVEYKIDGYHSDWEPYTDNTVISAEGTYKIFVRMISNSGQQSVQKYIESKIDKTKPSVERLVFTKNESGEYEVNLKALETFSGIKEVKLNTGVLLNLANGADTYSKYNIKEAQKPISLTITDNAGNTTGAVTFPALPAITYSNYTVTKEVQKETIKGSIVGDGVLRYKIDNKNYDCATSPCAIVIEENSKVTFSNEKSNLSSVVIQEISNVDRTIPRLVLNGDRADTDETKAVLNWNQPLTSAKLVCVGNDTITKPLTSGILSYNLSGIVNGNYDCHVEGTLYGESVTSNKLTIYPNYQKEIISNVVDVPKVKVNANIFLEESRLGDTYFINTNKRNINDSMVPVPSGVY